MRVGELTPGQAAEILSVTKARIYQMLAERQLSVVRRAGWRVFLRREEVVARLERKYDQARHVVAEAEKMLERTTESLGQ